MYKQFIRPLLFCFSAETAHNMTLAMLKALRHIPFGRNILKMACRRVSPSLEREVLGMKFPNPVGLAGGFDKNGELYNDMACLSFGFVEIGSLTPEPQDGNPKPRLFRIPAARAVINRMGMNNKGVRHAVENLRKDTPNVIIAGNISKNAATDEENAAADYEKAFALLYDFVDMFVVNLSCPNVVGLTALQDIGRLSEIMDRLINLRMYYDEYRPILIKVSPDLPHPQLDDIVDYCMMSGIDGIVAGNTTVTRNNINVPKGYIDVIGSGGMSGEPLFQKNLELVRYIHSRAGSNLVIIGAGGIMSGKQAREMLDAGASLVEIYTGMVYEGPSLVKKILKHLEKQAQ